MPNESKKQALIDDLRALLVEGQVATQEEICSALEALGHVANQSKISRLLRKIGVAKSKNELGEIVYRLPHEPAPPTTSSLLSNLVIDIVASESLIIVNTSPGAAQLIARMIDYNKKRLQILGTIAGDDSVFIAPKSAQTIKDSIASIRNLLF